MSQLNSVNNYVLSNCDCTIGLRVFGPLSFSSSSGTNFMTRLNYCYVTAKFYVGGCFSQSNFHSQIYISLFSNTNLTFTLKYTSVYFPNTNPTFTLSVLWHICLQIT